MQREPLRGEAAAESVVVAVAAHSQEVPRRPAADSAATCATSSAAVVRQASTADQGPYPKPASVPALGKPCGTSVASSLTDTVLMQARRQPVDAVRWRPESAYCDEDLSTVSLGRAASASDAAGETGRVRTRLSPVVHAEVGPLGGLGVVNRHSTDGGLGLGVVLRHSADDITAASPELLDTVRSPATSVYSDGRESRARVSWSPGLRNPDAHSDAPSSKASRRQRARHNMPDLTVYLPAGSGSGSPHGSSTVLDADRGSALERTSGRGSLLNGSINGRANSAEVAPVSPTRSYTMEAQGVVRPTPACRKCAGLEADVVAARTKGDEDIERARAEWRRQALTYEEETRRSRVQYATEEQALLGVRAKLRAEEAATAIAVESAAKALRELATETFAAQGASRWQQEAVESAVQLMEAENQREEASRRLDKVRKVVAEVERQKRDLLKQTGAHENARLRTELVEVASERDDLKKRLKALVPHAKNIQSEEVRWQEIANAEEMMSVENAKSAMAEKAEAERMRDVAKTLRRNLQGQIDNARGELEDARRSRHNAQEDLTREQQHRLDDARRHRGTKAESQSLKEEAEALRDQLRMTEMAFFQQMGEEKLDARATPSSPTRHYAVANNRERLSTGQAHLSLADARFAARRGNPHTVARATSLDSSRRASRGASPSGATSSRPSGALPSDDGVAPRSPQDAPRSIAGAIADELGSPLAQAALKNQVAFEERDRGSGDNITDGAAGGTTPRQAAEPKAPVPTQEKPRHGGGNYLPAPTYNSAGARLMEAIAKAKERADARRLLSGTAEDVRAKARALEELLTRDMAIYGI